MVDKKRFPEDIGGDPALQEGFAEGRRALHEDPEIRDLVERLRGAIDRQVATPLNGLTPDEEARFRKGRRRGLEDGLIPCITGKESPPEPDSPLHEVLQKITDVGPVRGDGRTPKLKR